MEKDRLQKLAGITEARRDPTEAWKDFTKVARDLEHTLRVTSVESGGPGRRSQKSLNPLQINDIDYHMRLIQQQLDRLDNVYSWRKYMEERKARLND